MVKHRRTSCPESPWRIHGKTQKTNKIKEEAQCLSLDSKWVGLKYDKQFGNDRLTADVVTRVE